MGSSGASWLRRISYNCKRPQFDLKLPVKKLQTSTEPGWRPFQSVSLFGLKFEQCYCSHLYFLFIHFDSLYPPHSNQRVLPTALKKMTHMAFKKFNSNGSLKKQCPCYSGQSTDLILNSSHGNYFLTKKNKNCVLWMTHSNSYSGETCCC